MSNAQTTEADRFDPASWYEKDFSERVKIGSEAYVIGGMGYPVLAYVFHAVKLILFVAGWLFFCGFTPGHGSLSDIQSWMWEGTAFKKAFIWACLVEVLGLSCMTGPLGLRLWPPFTAIFHFLRPGTIRLPFFPNAPLVRGNKRSIIDVAMYLGFVGTLFHALTQPAILAEHLIPAVILLPLCGLRDRTVILAARVEHHFMMITCFAFAGDFIAASKWVQLAIWFWAGVSKCTVAFKYVVPIMTANNPFLKSQWFRRQLFVNPPEDVNPSRLAAFMAHAGGFLEFAAPLTLVWVTADGPLLYVGMGLAIYLHVFIISNMPIAAVFEWNLMNLYAAFFLFWAHPEVSLFSVGSLPFSILLVVMLLFVPLLGNVVPQWVSFLLSMRYYAGNWAWNAWLFRGDSYEKLDRLKRVAPLLFQQQLRHLPPVDAIRADAAFLAFRALHLQGRTLGMMLPRMTDGRPFQEYTYADGETVAGSVLGWNFGEGHLCDESLVEAIQEDCQFESGEVRVLCVESQPIQGSSLHWRIVDAKDGQIAEGHATLDELAQRNPWDYGEVNP